MTLLNRLRRRAVAVGAAVVVMAGCGQASTGVDAQPTGGSTAKTAPATAAADPASSSAAPAPQPDSNKSLEEQTADAVAGFLAAGTEYGKTTEGIRAANGILYSDDLDVFQHDFGYLLAANEESLKGSKDPFRKLLVTLLQKNHPDLAARVAKEEFDEPLAPILRPFNGYSIPDKALKENSSQWCGDFIARFLTAYDQADAIRKQAFVRFVAQAKTCFQLAGKLYHRKEVVEFRDLSTEELSQLLAVVQKHRPEAADLFRQIILSERAETVKNNQQAAQRLLQELWSAQQRMWREDPDGNGVHDFHLGDWRTVLEQAQHYTFIGDAADADDRDFAGRYGYAVTVVRRASAAAGPRDATAADVADRDRRYFAYAATPVRYGSDGRPTFLIDERGILWMKDTDGSRPETVPDDPQQADWEELEASDGLRSPDAVPPRDLASLSLETPPESAVEMLRKTAPDSAVWSYVPQISALLKSPDSSVRAAAAELLGKVGPVSPATVAELSRLLTDEDAEVRRAAIDAVGQMEKSAGAVVEQLVPFVRDDEPLRREAVVALARIGDGAKPAALALRPLLNLPGAENADLRAAAAVALWRIDRREDDLLPHLINGLVQIEPVRELSQRALREIGEKAVQALAKTAADPNAENRLDAVLFLCEWGEPAKSAAPTILQLALQETEPADRLGRLDELRRFGRGVAVIVPELAKLLQSPDVDAQTVRTICAVLQGAGPGAEPAVPVLATLLKRANAAADESTATALLSALEAVGPQAAPALPVIEESARHESKAIVRAALFTLGKLGPAAAPVVPLLLEKIDDPRFRPPVVYALGEIGPAAKPALPALYRIRDDIWAVIVQDPANAEKMLRGVRHAIRMIEADSGETRP